MVMTKIWIDADGKQLRSTDDSVESFPGSVEAILTPAESGNQIWNGSAWAYSLDDEKARVINEINILRDQKKETPILSEGYQVDPGELSTGAMAVEIFAYSKSPKVITLLTFDGGYATADFSPKQHHIKDGATATVSGADQSDYNTTSVVDVVDKYKIKYPVGGAPASPATGSPIIALTTYRWITADNQTVWLTADEFAEIFQACTEYLDECQQRGRDLKDQVLACTTVAQIESIDITAGWPDTGL